jgi:pyruvate dehydrogenase E2 component (dihydrolipoamide acetyltransferase)
MAIEVVVPRLGWSMDEAAFGEWLKADGDVIKPGDALFVLEVEKAAQEVESLDRGILRIPPNRPAPGEIIRVGQRLAWLVQPGEPAPFESPSAPAQPSSAPPHEGAPLVDRSPKVIPGAAGARGAGTAIDADEESSLKISPRARRLATELGVDCTAIAGTGRGGRIRAKDILRAARPAAAARPAPPGRLSAITPARRIIAERMLAGTHQAAPVTLTTRANAANLVNARSRLKHASASAPEHIVPSYTDLFVKLCAETLKEHPRLNAQWRDDGIFVPDDIHIAFAVDTEFGLVAPVVRHADRLTILQVAEATRALIDQARRRALPAESMQGGTFTVTNLGALGVEAFTPILNVPQCAVLGIGGIRREPVVQRETIVIGDVVTLSLTFDHRVVDGAAAARFLDDLRRRLEAPELFQLT